MKRGKDGSSKQGQRKKEPIIFLERKMKRRMINDIEMLKIYFFTNRPNLITELKLLFQDMHNRSRSMTKRNVNMSHWCNEKISPTPSMPSSLSSSQYAKFYKNTSSKKQKKIVVINAE